MLVYHGTHKDNLESILKNGLYGGGGYDPSHLHAREADDPQNGCTPASLLEFVTFFWDDQTGEKPVGNSLGDLVCLEIDVTGISLDDGWDGPGTWACNQTIPPNRIRVLSDEETWSVGVSVPVSWRPSSVSK